MEINIENWGKGIRCLYVVSFDTGYYYIGSAKCFYGRTRSHQTNLRNYPEKFGIGIIHSPKKCNVYVLQTSDSYEYVVNLEREFLIYMSNDNFLLNKNKSISKLNNLKERLCKKMNGLKK